MQQTPEEGLQFYSALMSKMRELFVDLDFNCGIEGKGLQHVIHFSCFLDSQQSKKLPNDSLVTFLKCKSEEDNAPKKFGAALNYYFSFACIYGFHRHVS